ncbi:enolase C-terminal domain-like protein [Pararhizobium mangrovi]|uniref:enolase C-terminal domain-like protein n=1 Tax=Pararhizobium mangrovi TaxID=2590452 RepID=UPI001AEE479F|nr:enolase C-terminal domain-like protein [Pararhizobium mangrovi]
MRTAVDVLQADATRCLGYTGYLLADALAHAANLPLSSHCAPPPHLPVACASLCQGRMEWFHDHVRIEKMRSMAHRRPMPPARSRPISRARASGSR